MNPVSNLIGGDDVANRATRDPVGGHVSGRAFVCRAAVAADVIPAIRMILGNGGQVADESQAAEFMRVIARRGMKLSDIWVAEANGRVLWAVLPMVSPGRTMLLFGASPSFAGDCQAAVDATIDAVCEQYAAKNIQLAQVLLDPADTSSAGVYAGRGFARMAELIYLQRTVRRTAAPPPLPDPFVVRTYSPELHQAFGEAILASYEQSLDCPPLNGKRDVNDIILGHQAAGEFDPRDWMLLSHRDEAVAVLLLSRTIHGDGIELVYLGLSPAVRGHGLGDYFMKVAMARVSERKLGRLSLAVDALNGPALKLYHRHGMVRVTSKVAMMKELVTPA